MDSLLKTPRMSFAKTHELSQLPKKNFPDDSGWDLFSVEDITIPAKNRAVVPVGLKLAYLEAGYWITISPRSGLAFKNGLTVHPGVIDNGYRGDLGVLMFNHSDIDYKVKAGDRIAQIILHFNVSVEASWSDVTETARGEKGFGSSGK